MKKFLLPLFLVCLIFSAMAQAPDKMSYQTVIRDLNNTLLVNQPVKVKISLLQGSSTGSAVYVETQSKSTNGNGLLSLEIGSGSAVSGSISGINWSNGPYFIKSETDPNGGSNYTISGTTQMLSVPYALHAKSAGSVLNPEWTETNGNVYRSTGYVGIGTSNPEYPLQISWSGQSGAQNETRGISVYTQGQNTNGSYLNQGIFSQYNSDVTGGRSIWGVASGNNFGVGVVGESDVRATSQGVSGYSLSKTGDANNKTGVLGWARGAWDGSGAGTGNHYGVYGLSEGSSGQESFGVLGRAQSAATNNYGACGLSFGSGTRNFGLNGESYGKGNINIGVAGFGRSSKGSLNVGVYGASIQDSATTTYGVFAENTTSSILSYQTALFAHAANNPKQNFSVDGTSDSPVGDSYGITGWAYGANKNYAVYGYTSGGTTAYAGFFDGNLHYTGALTTPSDRRLKSDIKPMVNALSALAKINPVTYTFKKDMVENLHLDNKPQFGFIAQELESVFPDLVKEEKAPVFKVTSETNEAGMTISKKELEKYEEYKAINYVGLIPVLTKAIQEQQEMIQKLQNRIKVLEDQRK